MTATDTRPPKPPPPALPAEHPAAPAVLELAAEPKWVVWDWVWNDKVGKWDKPPRTASGGAASSTDPRTWTTYAAALTAARRQRWGVGRVLDGTGDLVAWDFDHCIDPAAGEIDPTTWRRVRRLGSYAEISPSGTGVRVFVKGKLPPEGRKKGDVECYETGRYLTVTGQHLEGTPDTIEERQDAIDELHAEVFRDATSGATADGKSRTYRVGRPIGEMDDDELIAKIRSTTQGGKFDALFHRGDAEAYHGGDESVADLALCCIFAWWTSNDRPRIERLFGRSKLAERGKWQDRPDYRARTVEAAIARTTTTVLDGSGDPPEGLGDVGAPRPKPSAPADEPWEEPVPLGRADAPPVFPVGALPDWQREYVEALAEETQTPVDLAGVLVLPAVATAAQGRVEVEPRPGWREQVNVFVASVLPPRHPQNGGVFRHLDARDAVRGGRNRTAAGLGRRAERDVRGHEGAG